VVCWLCV